MKKTLAVVFAVAFLSGSSSLLASEGKLKTVAALYQEKSALAGQLVTVKGRVVKVNSGIMGKNFLHIEDGTGDRTRKTNDLTVTSKETAAVGDQVTVSGRVMLDKDFGSGYVYPLLIEEAKISK